MKTTILKITTLVIIAFSISSCSKSDEHTLCTDFLRGEWIIEDWGVNPSGDNDLYFIYVADDNEMILTEVPANSYGFEPGEVSIKNIDVTSEEEFEAQIKLRYTNGDFEWINLTMMVENEDLIRTKMDCTNCNTLGSLIRG